MIKIIAKRVIKADCVEAFQALAREMVTKSRAEPGCLSYTLNQSIADPRVHCFIEIWDSQEAIDAHNASEHFVRLVPQFNGLTEQRQAPEKYIQL